MPEDSRGNIFRGVYDGSFGQNKVQNSVRQPSRDVADTVRNSILDFKGEIGV